MENKTKNRLKKKLQQKNGETSSSNDNSDLFNMLNDVNKILKGNPEMVKKVSKCVNDIMTNKDLMESLAKQLNIEETLKSEDQTSSNKEE